METTSFEIPYSTSQLVDRAYIKLKALSSSSDKRAFCKPEIIKHNRKSYITNFIKFCDSINREPEYVKKFIDTYMNSTTSIISDNNMNDDKSGLKFNNIFKPDLIMNSITNYMKEYVLCNLCKSGNTQIKKRDRISYICCNNCKADRAIA
jgi:translation initiation factor 2 subunit 2